MLNDLCIDSMNKLPPTETAPVKILAADDNQANLRLLGEFLRNLNADVTPVNNGIQALNAVEQQDFDLIFMDIRMPHMDGKEATRKIRERETPEHRTPIVALTAGRIEEQKTDLLITGMDDFLEKPVNHGKLEEVIQRWTHKEIHSVTETKEVSTEIEIDDGQIFNLSQSLKLVHGKADLAKDMFTMLLNSLDNTLVGINEALQGSNREALHDTVHQLHGGCCYCGVPLLKEAASLVDDQLQKGLEDNLETNINTLIERIKELQDWAGNQDIKAMFTT